MQQEDVASLDNGEMLQQGEYDDPLQPPQEGVDLEGEVVEQKQEIFKDYE